MSETNVSAADPRRLEKARAIVAEGGVIQVDPDTWRVASQSGSGHHEVSRIGANGTAGLACTCPDWLGRNDVEAGLSLSACKHVLAVELAVEGESGPAQDRGQNGASTGQPWATDEGTALLLDEAEEEEVEEQIRECRHEQQADVILWTIGVLEEQIEQVEALARQEAAVIESWRASEVGRHHARIQEISGLLDGFMRVQKRKSLFLPHGELRLRAMQDRLTINEGEFRLDQEALVRIIPEKRVPDLMKIRQFIKSSGGVIPDGVEIEPQPAKFSYTTMRQKLLDQKRKEVKDAYGELQQAQAAD